MFRRLSTRARKDTRGETKELFSSLPNEQKTVIRAKILACFNTEQVASARNKIGDAVAEIARQYVDVGEIWPELLGTLFQASQSPTPGLRDSAFRIFATTPGIIEKQHEEAVQGVFAKGFKDEEVNVWLL